MAYSDESSMIGFKRSLIMKVNPEKRLGRKKLFNVLFSIFHVKSIIVYLNSCNNSVLTTHIFHEHYKYMYINHFLRLWTF